mgnify:CR=1 FL=1
MAPRSLTDGETIIIAGYVLSSMLIASLTGFAIVVRDERKLSPRKLERAWPPVTRDMVLGFGALMGGVLPVAFGVFLHFLRTRRGWKGVGLGLLGFVLVLVPVFALGSLIDFIVPDLPDID